ncbi:MAG: thermonuclease family protein [Desulfobacterales bacterium]
MKSVFNIPNVTIFFAVISLFAVFPLFSIAGQFQVVSVYDGDTVKVTENGKKITIRLVGIDAPEMSHKKHLPGQPFCAKAKDHLSSLILNKVIHIKIYGKDESGTFLGEIFANNVNINIEMINAGLAEVHRGPPVQGHEMTGYRAAEKKAKEDTKGIWELRDQYFSPWDWREMYNIRD